MMISHKRLYFTVVDTCEDHLSLLLAGNLIDQIEFNVVDRKDETIYWFIRDMIYSRMLD